VNERIRLLIEQATTRIDPTAHDGACWDFDKEKFAELIVKKCMDVAKYHTPDTEECEYTWLIHDKIQKYFGVEE
jgi:hypothetical protein